MKQIGDSLDSGYGVTDSDEMDALGKVAEETAAYQAMSPSALSKELNQLEKQMFKHAKSLEFEEASLLRDKIEKVKEYALGPQN